MAKAARSKAPRAAALVGKGRVKAGGKHQGPALAEFCRSLPHTTEDIKWGDNHMFSIGGKIYAGFDIEPSDSFGFRADQDSNGDEFLRLIQIDGVIPAPYAAKYGWVKVERRGVIPMDELKRLIRRSYQLVGAGLSKRMQTQLGLIDARDASAPVKKSVRSRRR